MRDSWSVVWTPQFLVGTVIAGLLLNVLAAYVVRVVDRVRVHLPAYFRRARDEEAARVQLLYAAAASDNALYAALAAEAGRLRLRQLLSFFIAFVAIATLVFLLGVSEIAPIGRITAVAPLQVAFVIVLFVPLGLLQFIAGLEHSRRATRLDAALREVHRKRSLPIMD